MSHFFSGKTLLITGAHGFLGTHLRAALVEMGTHPLCPRSSELDLCDAKGTQAYLEQHQPDLIFHLAAKVGGVGAMKAHPASFLHDNVIMGLNLIEAARRQGCQKVVVIGTSCGYPKDILPPFKEEDFLAGYPEPQNAGYGIAKRLLWTQGYEYRQAYGMNIIHVIPTNLFGEFDHFDNPQAHVIPSLIRRFQEAIDTQAPFIELWGSGQATRDFLYVKDGIHGILLAAEHYNEAEPINISSGHEMSIRQLAERLSEIMGYTGNLHWDTSKPEGVLRRALDCSKAVQLLGFQPQYPLMEALEQTVQGFRLHAQCGAQHGV